MTCYTWTLTKAIDFVFWECGSKALTADEIYQRLPLEMMTGQPPKWLFVQTLKQMCRRKKKPLLCLNGVYRF